MMRVLRSMSVTSNPNIRSTATEMTQKKSKQEASRAKEQAQAEAAEAMRRAPHFAASAFKLGGTSNSIVPLPSMSYLQQQLSVPLSLQWAGEGSLCDEILGIYVRAVEAQRLPHSISI